MATIGEFLNERRQNGLLRRLRPWDRRHGATITVDGREYLDFSSNDYLGFAQAPQLVAAMQEALAFWGVGSGGSRLLGGDCAAHHRLEEETARFKEKEAACLFNSGYQANVGILPALCGRGDAIFCDRLSHASLLDGALLTQARLFRFRHNDCDHLEELLKEQRAKFKNSLIVTETVFSMDGDIVNLPEMIRLCRKFKATLMVDEAHSLGVLGEKGTGIEEHFGIDPEEGLIDVKMGTLSKTIPSIGGYVAGSAKLVNYLKHSIRPFIFSASLPPASAAAATAAFEVMEEEPWRVKKLRENTAHFLKTLRARGFNTLNSQTPIVPILIGDEAKALEMTRLAREEGIFIVPILPPAVPPHTTRIRATVTAGHSNEEIDRAAFLFEKIARSLDVRFLKS